MWSRYRSGFGRGGSKTTCTKGAGKHDVLSPSHDLAKLNPKCHMNHLNIFTEISFFCRNFKLFANFTGLTYFCLLCKKSLMLC